jgi:hypothetical protein
MVEVRVSYAGSVEGARFEVRAAGELFAKRALVPVSHAFRRMVRNPDGCDKHGHFRKVVRGT